MAASSVKYVLRLFLLLIVAMACVDAAKCTKDNEVKTEGKCVCKNDHYRKWKNGKSKACFPCEDDTKGKEGNGVPTNGDMNKRCQCKSNPRRMVINIINKEMKCDCAPTFNGNYPNCKCHESAVKVEDSNDASKDTCVCKNGGSMDDDNKCISPISPLCPVGYFRSSGVCTFCIQPLNNNAVIDDPDMSDESWSGRCYCPSASYEDPSNTVTGGNNCYCNFGTFRDEKNHKCEKCSARNRGSIYKYISLKNKNGPKEGFYERCRQMTRDEYHAV